MDSNVTQSSAHLTLASGWSIVCLKIEITLLQFMPHLRTKMWKQASEEREIF